MSKGKRKSMDDVLASMGGMKAARPAPEPVPVEASASEAPAVEEMSLEEAGQAVSANIRAALERQQQETDEYNAARTRGESPPLPKGVTVVARKRKPAEETAPPVDPETNLKPEPAEPIRRESGSTRARAHVRKEELARQTRPASVPRGYNVRPPRIEKPHQSVYADPAVWKVIRQIALAEDVKPQDLYREALRTMLKKRGYDFDKLDRGEA